MKRLDPTFGPLFLVAQLNSILPLSVIHICFVHLNDPERQELAIQDFTGLAILHLSFNFASPSFVALALI